LTVSVSQPRATGPSRRRQTSFKAARRARSAHRVGPLVWCERAPDIERVVRSNRLSPSRISSRAIATDLTRWGQIKTHRSPNEAGVADHGGPNTLIPIKHPTPRKSHASPPAVLWPCSTCQVAIVYRELVPQRQIFSNTAHRDGADFNCHKGSTSWPYPHPSPKTQNTVGRGEPSVLPMRKRAATRAGPNFRAGHRDHQHLRIAPHIPLSPAKHRASAPSHDRRREDFHPDDRDRPRNSWFFTTGRPLWRPPRPRSL